MNDPQKIFQKLKIGVDLDGVIADVYQVMVRMVKSEYGLDIEKLVKKRGFGYWWMNWPEVKAIDGCSEFIIQKFNEPEVYQEACLIKGSLKVLQKWQRQGHQIWLITARPPNLKATTLNWLKANGFGWLVRGFLIHAQAPL